VAESPILLDIRDGIARVTLNRPDRLNSFNDAMHAALRDALAHVRADASVRVMLLTGAGAGSAPVRTWRTARSRPEKPPSTSAPRSSATTCRLSSACATCRCRCCAR
jgi:hypothetical protein